MSRESTWGTQHSLRWGLLVFVCACGDGAAIMTVPQTTAGGAAIAGVGAVAGAAAVSAGSAGAAGLAAAGAPGGAASGAPGSGAAGTSGMTQAGAAAAGSGGEAAAAGSGGDAAGSGGASGAGGAAASGGTSGSAGAAGSVAGSGGAAGRAGAGGAGGSAGAGGAAGSAGAPADAYMPPCMASPDQVVLIGDSYINYTNDLAPLIEARAIEDGALMFGQQYRDYAQPGTSLATGGLQLFPSTSPLIPPQWDLAVREDPDIKFVIFDGGGNDVLTVNSACLEDGAERNPDCMKIAQDAIAAAKGLLADYKAGGVSEVIQFFYPHTPSGGHDLLDWALPMYQAACEAASTDSFHCHFVDTRPTFEGRPEYFASDDIHPSAIGAAALADQLYGVMKDECFAQPSSKGCCKP
jgi:lysophospholipase L1-like esterase